MAHQSEQQPQQMQIKLPDEILKGVYANAVQVAHTPEEFILDFFNLFPPAGIVNARIFVSPAHMKRFLAALQDNIQRYEDQYGKISFKNAPASDGINPGGPVAPTTTSSSGRKYGFDTEKAE